MHDNNLSCEGRESSIELLRIVCILMIIACHYSVHSGLDVPEGLNLSANQVIAQLLTMFGRMPCAVFAIITGFFMITAQGAYIPHSKKVMPLLAEMLFYSLVILAIAVVFRLTLISNTLVIKAFFPFFWDNWFISYYIILYLMIPFINPFIRTLDKRCLLHLIFFLLVIWCVVPTFAINSWEFSKIDFFFVFYLIGAYIRIYGKNSTGNWKNMILFLSFAGLMLISVILFDVAAIVLNIPVLAEHATYLREFSSVLSVPCAIYMFLAFKDLTLHSTTINKAASHVLGIYLIHENTLMRDILWMKISPAAAYMNSPWLIVHAVAKVAAVFLVCIMIDITRERLLGVPFKRWVNNNYEIIANQIKGRVDNVLDRLF